MDDLNQPNQPNISGSIAATATATEIKPLLKNPPGGALRAEPNYLLWILSGAIGLIFLVLVAAVVIAANLVISSAKNLPKLTPTPAPVAEVTPPIIHNANPISQFATDAAVLSLSSDLKKLRQDIDSIDLFETQLSPPSLDLSIRVTIQE
jgi:predicted PurR-regulated permease PerM